MKNKKWFMNGGRGSGQTLRKITEVYENKIAELEKKLTEKVTLESLDVVSGKIADLQAQIEKMKNCGNCKNYSPTYGLCCYSLGDEDYDCRLRKWEIKEK